MPKTKPAYTEQFKRDVLAYQASTGCSFKAAAVHFGVSANSMREWQMRCEILKKTVGIFSVPSGNNSLRLKP